jgi:hypothetical protein
MFDLAQQQRFLGLRVMGTILEAEEDASYLEEMASSAESVKLNGEINLLEEASILTNSSNMCFECLQNKIK